MVHGVITGNRVLQNYLKEKYWQGRDAGLTKREAHSFAFQETLAANEEGYVIMEDGEEFVEEEEIVNPYTKVIADLEHGPL